MAGKMKALQLWCQQKTSGYKNVNITNMTTSWRDGLAFCALIHHYRPDLIDFDSLDKENVLHNNKLAFEIAEKELEIAALLDPEDMVAMKVPDKLSVITYVSQYYNNLNKLQPAAKGAPMKRTASPPPVKVEVKRVAKDTELTKPVLKEKVQKFSICEICKKKVHLVERYIDEGKVYHRHCHRTQSLSGIYRREGSVAMHNYMDTSATHQKPNDPPIDTKTNPFKAQVLQSKTNKASEVPKTDSSKPGKEEKPTPVSSDSKAGRHFHVTDMVSKFSTNNSEKQWIPPSKRHSRTPSPSSVSRNSTDSSELKSSPLKEPHVGSKSSPKHTWTPSSTSSVGSSKRNSTESADTKDGNPFEDAAEEPTVVAKTPDKLSVHSSPDKKVNHDKKPEPSTNANKIDLTTKDPVVNNSNNEVLSPSATKDMLPSLLKSLADVKEQKQQDKKAFLTVKNDISPTSKTEPLIKELPKVTQPPIPSSRTEIAKQEYLEKPKPQPRLSKASSNTTSDTNQDEVDYNDSLNPFADSDTEMNEEPSPDADESLNPFGEEEENEEAESSDGGNPFGEDEETYDDKTSEPQTRTENGRRTINVAGPNELRVNPFTQEYEHKKEAKAIAVAEGTPPKPPSRRKGHAPPPPQRPVTPKASPHKASEKKVLSPPSVVPPERKHKRAAPSWKNEMEKKMEKVNDANKTDGKYVAKTNLKTPSPSSAPAATKTPTPSPSSKSNKGVSRLPSKPARPAPGFGFPLVKRKVKSQMTEEEISTEMKVLDVQLKDLEKKGVKLEEVLRDDMDSAIQRAPHAFSLSFWLSCNDHKPESDQMLSDWFDLVQQKNKLVRRETDLVFLMQQQRLEQQHADVEFKIRKLLNKPDNEKTDAEKEEEAKLVEDLVKIVERRNTIINSIEEARVKEEEEDAAYDMMKKMQRDSPNDSDTTKKKKKNKVKKMFSKRKKPEKSQSSSQQE
uniref:MICAL-like protein 1 n=1 Tax=Phallusia mammillata TaxID=59560 RepID=A0A6F9DK68_9ASCI|nr:MICAL-like protein 1 [Phallusia mammillata]